MDKWSVALFGHWKPRFELREKEKKIIEMPLGRNAFGQYPTRKVAVNKTVGRFVDEPIDFDKSKYFIYNVVGWEKRAEPGDVIGFRPYEERDRWTPTERKHFLIVTIEGPSIEQMAYGMVEPEWDLNSYFDYEVEPFDVFIERIKEKVRKAPGQARAKEWFSKVDKEKIYKKHLETMADGCRYPTEHVKKRRMRISLQELEERGVHISSMLEKDFIYSPDLSPIRHTFIDDKLKARRIVDSDGLNRIPPRKVR